MHYINDSRYVPEDENRIQTLRLKPKQLSVQVRAAAEKCTDDYRKQETLEVVTLKNIRAGEELFVDYGA